MRLFYDGMAMVGMPVVVGWVVGLAVADAGWLYEAQVTTETPRVLAASTEAPEASDRVSAVATVYWAVEGQTDASPLVTADGSRVDLNALERGELRWCAVSRDLLKRWGGPLDYGDTVRVEGCGDLDGEWVVRDTMNRRFGAVAPTYDHGVPGVVEPQALAPVRVDGRHHIDLLVPQGQMGRWEEAVIHLDS